MITTAANDHGITRLDFTDHGEGDVAQHLFDASTVAGTDLEKVARWCFGKSTGDLIREVFGWHVIQTDLNAEPAGEGHLGGGHEQATFTEIMGRTDESLGDQAGHGAGVARTCFQIHSRKRLVLQVGQLREVGTAQRGSRLSDQEQQVSG